MSNRLARERSPYLLQHANNPVDWYPWGEEAFAKARAEDKPIFLSIGYSTCHWCHVMEHESFENSQIAEVLSRDFVAVKVDREERPDVDRVYMTFVQATTGSGGWPMSVWLTPELKPFYGGTYYPPTSRWGRPGFAEVLAEIARAWREERSKVTHSAETLLERLQETQGSEGDQASPKEGRRVGDAASLATGVQQYEGSFDRRFGGFGSSPKFPRPSELLFLLREHVRTGSPTARDMVLETLRAMARGGMRDHIGGGFHRYSVDAEWRVPHFEKMLYDQAQLVVAYLEAAQVSGDPFFSAVADDTLAYVRRDMTDAAGGFYSAEDADSVPSEDAADPAPHKVEGAFYVWRDQEIGELLGPDAEVIRARFGIEPAGNAPSDPQGEFRGKNLFYTARSIEDVARITGRSPDDVMRILAGARQRMFDVRLARPRPHLDDKILTGWNGLMIAAFARAARVRRTDDVGAAAARRWLESARRAASFIRETLWKPDARLLLRRYRDGEAAIAAYCEDYSYLIWGLLELFQADSDVTWLRWALQLQARQDELFWDPIDGGWFSTTGDDPSVLLRLKEDYDGAEPAASSVSVLNLLTFAHLNASTTASDQIDRTLARHGLHLGRLARVVPFALAAASTYHSGLMQIVIIGRPSAPDTQAMLRALAGRYLPFSIQIAVEPGSHQASVAELLPFIADMTMRGDRATAYVCRDFTCLEPTTDAGRIGDLVVAGMRD